MSPRGRPIARAAELSIQEALQRFVEHAALPFAVTRGQGHTIVYANSAFCRLTGTHGGELIGAKIGALFSPTEAAALTSVLDASYRDRVEIVDGRIDAVSGTGRAWQCNVWPVIAPSGLTEALGIEIRDTKEHDASMELQREVAERMLFGALRERGLADDAEAARRRAAFLAEAGRSLAESVDQSSTLVALTRLALPSIAAWCIVDIIGEGGAIRRLGIYHPDPARQALARELEPIWIPEKDDPFGAAAMLRDARLVSITEDVEQALARSAHSPGVLHILRHLGIGSLLSVPLVARHKLLGAITFVGTPAGEPFTSEDIQLAEDIATRGALALDSSQVYDMARTLQQTAETASRAKTAFLGAMSHELRTPLNAIGGYIDLLDMGLRGPVTESQHADFARVRTNQRHLVLLITELLNFARVGTGSITTVSVGVKACDALRGAIELVEPLFGQKGLTFEGVFGDETAVARADPDRVAQVLVNLLSNAIKFTPAGGRIRGECATVGDVVTLAISDTGIGIPREKQESIFEPFIQLKESLSDRESGIGLGLAISRDLARSMKGNLTVESDEGKGARFILSLPHADGKDATR
jgi:signal transduction histidine kinase